MNKDFYKGNRERLYAQLQENSLLVLFAGVEVRKTNDEFYPFYTNRNFLYLTGLDQKELALIARKDSQGQVAEKVYILPPPMTSATSSPISTTSAISAHIFETVWGSIPICFSPASASPLSLSSTRLYLSSAMSSPFFNGGCRENPSCLHRP